MLKKTIKYTDFDGVERTEEHYFHLSKPELMEMQFEASGGLEKVIKKIIDTEDTKKMMEIFKDLILRSYGEKSLDGKRFVKVVDGRRLADDFAQTGAYEELFMELATNEQSAADFINGVIPQSLKQEIASRG